MKEKKQNLRYPNVPMDDIERRKTKRKKTKIIKTIITVFLICIMLVFAGFLGMNYFVNYSGVTKKIYYTPSQNIKGVSFKNSFVFTTTDGIRMVKQSGEDVNEQVSNAVSPFVKGMTTPTFETNDKTVLVYDLNGRSAVLFNEGGVIQTYNFPKGIIKGRMSQSGQFVFILEEDGSKAVVRVYGVSGSEIMSWYSGTGYVVDACINDKQNTMAVLTNEFSKGVSSSKILFFSLDNPDPIMGKIIGSYLASYVSYCGDSAFVVCNDALYNITKGGNVTKTMDFTQKKVKYFKSFPNGNIAIFSENTMEQKCNVEIFNIKGRKISDFSIESFLNICDVSNNKFLVVKRKGVLCINSKGKILKEIQCDFEVKNASFFKNKIMVFSQDEILIK